MNLDKGRYSGYFIFNRRKDYAAVSRSCAGNRLARRSEASSAAADCAVGANSKDSPVAQSKLITLIFPPYPSLKASGIVIVALHPRTLESQMPIR